MGTTYHHGAVPIARGDFESSVPAGEPLPAGIPCTICGAVRPLALLAFDEARRTIALCADCATRRTTRQAVVALMLPKHGPRDGAAPDRAH